MASFQIEWKRCGPAVDEGYPALLARVSGAQREQGVKEFPGV